ncbi:amidohydrolase family protein [Allobranchiibius sp. GilTou38]|nr:amidohydrolase family protein [Allobranchiibius sp. GilTou38]
MHASTVASACFSGEKCRRGRIAAGQYADLAILDEDYMTAPTDALPAIEPVYGGVAGTLPCTPGEPLDGRPPPVLTWNVRPRHLVAALS